MPKKSIKSQENNSEQSAASPKLTRTKHVTRHCVYCGKETKMSIVGEMNPANSKIWYKCTRCRHMSLLEPLQKISNETALLNIDIGKCTPYKPELVYNIGQMIFHNDLNDAGRVMSKQKTSNGGNAIIVAFKNSGQKMLVENIRGNFSSGYSF
jgi:hypothetical protein